MSLSNNNDENDSPWDRAASSSPAVRLSSTLPDEPRIPSHYLCCSRRNIQKTLQLWICFDICLTIGLISCLYLEPRHHRSFDWIAGVAAALLLLRSVWSCCGFSTDWVCERSTLLWSARISWILIAVASGGALFFFFFFYFGTIPHTPSSSSYNNQTRRMALQIWLWMIAGMELIRFFLLRHYYRFQVQRDRDDLRRSLLDTSEALRQRPWWWEAQDENISQTREDGLEWTMENHNNNNTSFLTTRPTGEQSSSSWWDSVFFWGSNANNHGQQNDDLLRDEGSVDFVSVQDEWATRSEQDPYWWSRDEAEGQSSQQQQQQDKKKGSSSSILPTWIQTSSSSGLPKLQRNNSHSSIDE